MHLWDKKLEKILNENKIAGMSVAVINHKDVMLSSDYAVDSEKNEE